MRKLDLTALPSVRVARWYLSLEYFWAIIGFLLIPAVFMEIQIYKTASVTNEILQLGLHIYDDKSLWIKWILIKGAGFIVFYLYLLLVKSILTRFDRKVLKASQLFLIAVFGGLLNGLVQHELSPILDIFETGTHFARIVSPVPSSVMSLFVLSILTSNIGKYHRESKKAQSAANSLFAIQQIQLKIVGDFKEVSDALTNKVAASSKAALYLIRNISAGTNLMDPSISEEIRLISDTTIRDLSHQIEATYEESQAEQSYKFFSTQNFSALRIFLDSFRFAPLHPGSFATACSLLILGPILRQASWIQTPVVAIIIYLAIFLAQWPSLFLYRYFQIQNIFSVVLTMLLSSGIPYYIFTLINGHWNLIPHWDENPTHIGVFFVAVLLVSIVGYFMQAGLLRSEDILRLRRDNVVNTKISINPINKEIILISRNWARHLHGRVQSQILAATFTLENAQRVGDVAEVQKAFEQIEAILENADQIDSFNSISLSEELDKRIKQWTGIIEIAMQIPPEIAAQTGLEIQVIADIIDEMITNASRHGAATKIRIELTRRMPIELRIKAIDNGAYFDTTKKGFGLRFFDEVSQGRWDISRNEAFGETTVSVLFELEESGPPKKEFRDLKLDL